MRTTVYEYDIVRYSYSQKCMTHFESKGFNVLDCLNRLSAVMNKKELAAITLIEMIRKLRKKDLTPSEINIFYNK